MRISNNLGKYGQEGQYVGPPSNLSADDIALIKALVAAIARYVEAKENLSLSSSTGRAAVSKIASDQVRVLTET